MESNSPANVNTQNGKTSRRKLTLPSWAHTHRLFRKNTGMAVSMTAPMFETTGCSSRIPTERISSTWVMVTPMTETAEYLMASAPRPPVTRSSTAAGDIFTDRSLGGGP